MDRDRSLNMMQENRRLGQSNNLINTLILGRQGDHLLFEKTALYLATASALISRNTICILFATVFGGLTLSLAACMGKPCRRKFAPLAKMCVKRYTG
jgi:hypothetical protein